MEDSSRGVEIGDPHRQILVEYGVFESCEPSNLVLQPGLEVPGVDIDAVRQRDKKNAVDILQMKGRVLFPGLPGFALAPPSSSVPEAMDSRGRLLLHSAMQSSTCLCDSRGVFQSAAH